MEEEKSFFDVAFGETLLFEGGYANIQGDSGGETFIGVSRNNFKKWKGWVIIDKIKDNFGGVISKEFKEALKRSESLLNEVKTFYKEKFWNKLLLDQINSVKITSEIFDTAINCGIRIAVRCLQNALNILNRNESDRFYDDLIVDGLIGNKTINAVKILLSNNDEQALLSALNGEQYFRYRSIISKNPKLEAFVKSWLRRTRH